ncbi:MAG TPA: LPS assembly protein LptD, partial [Opitutales bacterium]|nr:LPS assembly protein LptD [Opitutales bacterium]
MSRSPRLAAWLFLAALLGAGATLSPSIVRADPPPLIIPSSEPAPQSAPTTKANSTSATSTATPDFGTLSVAPDGKIEDLGNGQYKAEKDVDWKTPEFDLQASMTLTLDKNTGQGAAEGDVVLAQSAMRVLMRKVQFDTQQNTIAADAVRLGKAPAYMDAGSFTMSKDAASMTDTTIFFGEPDPFGLNVHSPSATYYGNTGDVVLHGATVRLGAWPIFYVPSYTQGRVDQPPLSILDHFGYRNDLGAYIQTTTFYTKNSSFEPGALLDYYSKRGVLAGPALKYDTTGDANWGQDGTLESGYIHDYGNRGLDISNNTIPTDRFFVDWQHQGTLGGKVDVTSTMSWWSDSNVLRDFRQSTWQNNQLPDNFVEASTRAQNSLTSLFVRYNPDNFEVVQQRLPEVRYDYFPTSVGKTGIYQEGFADYAQLDQQNFNGTPTLHSNRIDGYYGLRRPFNLGDGATITPVAGGLITQYQDTLNDQGTFTRMLGQVGFDGEMRMTGRWDYTNETWGINGLQHVLRPVIMYRYIPAAQQGQGLIPVIDQDISSSYPPIYDL